MRSSVFEDESLFPRGSTEFDSALLMRGIEHEWHGRDDLCCAPGDSNGRAFQADWRNPFRFPLSLPELPNSGDGLANFGFRPGGCANGRTSALRSGFARVRRHAAALPRALAEDVDAATLPWTSAYSVPQNPRLPSPPCRRRNIRRPPRSIASERTEQHMRTQRDDTPRATALTRLDRAVRLRPL